MLYFRCYSTTVGQLDNCIEPYLKWRESWNLFTRFASKTPYQIDLLIPRISKLSLKLICVIALFMQIIQIKVITKIILNKTAFPKIDDLILGDKKKCLNF